MEIWKDVVGYEGLYEVSNKGRVRSLPKMVWKKSSKGEYFQYPVRGKILCPWSMGRYGHLYVGLYPKEGGKGTMKTIGIAPIVLMAFVGPCPEGYESCHYPDRDPSNNKLSNLRWGTPKDNADDLEKHGTHVKGSKSYRAKLTEEDIPVIRKLLKKYGNVWGGMSKIARMYNIAVAGIKSIRDGETWKHVPLEY